MAYPRFPGELIPDGRDEHSVESFAVWTYWLANRGATVDLHVMPLNGKVRYSITLRLGPSYPGMEELRSKTGMFPENPGMEKFIHGILVHTEGIMPLHALRTAVSAMKSGEYIVKFSKEEFTYGRIT